MWRKSGNLDSKKNRRILSLHAKGDQGTFPLEYVDPSDCYEIYTQILQSIPYLHEKNVALKKIKPSNIVFGFDGKVEIGDVAMAIFGEMKNGNVPDNLRSPISLKTLCEICLWKPMRPQRKSQADLTTKRWTFRALETRVADSKNSNHRTHSTKFTEDSKLRTRLRVSRLESSAAFLAHLMIIVLQIHECYSDWND